MKVRNILLVAASLCITLGAYAQKKKTFYVPKAGTLVELMTQEEANQITHLTLQGKLNAIDFRHLRDEFTNLQVLDISNATISMYTGKNGTFPDKFYIYPGNCIPAYAFCKQNADGTYQGKASLEHVILSEKTKNIEDAAFKGCTNLKICQIRKKTAPNLLPGALADSITAIFVPLGSSDSYRNKERWENFSFVEGNPTAVTVQIAKMGSLASELLNAGVQPRDVNFLTIEGKMDEADFKLIRDYMPNLVSVNMEKCNATVIPEYTFTQKKYMLNITLPKGLTTIGQRAFSGCTRLTGTLVLPASVTAIEYGAFIGCDNLRRVLATGSKITTLGENLFGESNTTNKIVYQSAQ
ncbi:leucine-rich repeat protein [uncultured Mediterranea sp.]|uniref:leucine-rich repeat domain-containing protein n=1 Tax=uncultured Mediterranea sp. TaxID=1926662 RepID=UPI0027D9C3FE|nr:leucine-rich repeat protein [uncultured Mediterranea sp.]